MSCARLLLCSLTALVLGACSPAGDAAEGAQGLFPGPPQAIIGRGVYQFIPERACESVSIFIGGQGFTHLWTSVRVRYMNLKDATLHLSLIDEQSQELLSTTDLHIDFVAIAPSALEVTNDMAQPLPSGCLDGGISYPSFNLDLGDAIDPVPGGNDGWAEYSAATDILPKGWLNGCLMEACATGRPMRQRVDVTDSLGLTASDERLLVPYLRAADESTYCVGDVDMGIPAADLGGVACLQSL